MTGDLERQGRLWTREEETYLAWAYSQGLSVEWAAKHLQRSVPATKQKASRLHLEHPRFGRSPGPRDLATALMQLQGLRPPRGPASSRAGRGRC